MQSTNGIYISNSGNEATWTPINNIANSDFGLGSYVNFKSTYNSAGLRSML